MDLDRLKERGSGTFPRSTSAPSIATLAEHHGSSPSWPDRTASPTLRADDREYPTTSVGRVLTGFLDDEDADAAPPDLTLLRSLLRGYAVALKGRGRTGRRGRRPSAVGPKDHPVDGHLWSDDGRLRPGWRTPEGSDQARSLRDRHRRDSGRHPEPPAGVPKGRGGPDRPRVIEADEMAVAQRDMTLATAVGFRRRHRPVSRVPRRPRPAGVRDRHASLGCASALGLATLTVGTSSILTIVFVPMLIGLGDHSIHFLTRFEEERAAGRPLADALGRTFAGTGIGIVAATGTTALAFAMLMLTGFKGLVELGLISASGVLLTAGRPSPCCPRCWSSRRAAASRFRPAVRRTRVDRSLTRWHRHSAVILAVSGVLGGLGGCRGRRRAVRPQSRQPPGAEQRRSRLGRAGRRAHVAVRPVRRGGGRLARGSRPHAAALQARPSVAAVDSVLSVLPGVPSEKRALIRGSVRSSRHCPMRRRARARRSRGAPVRTRADPLQDGRRGAGGPGRPRTPFVATGGKSAPSSTRS